MKRQILNAATMIVFTTMGWNTQVGAQPADPAGSQENQELLNQIVELRTQVAEIARSFRQGGMVAAPSSNPTAQAQSNAMAGMQNSSTPAAGGAMGMDGGMPMMDDDMNEMPMAKGGMPMMDGMEMMGMTTVAPGQQDMSMASSLPGFPGASHLYHVGATGFFLDHPEHITLSVDQKRRLAEAKEASLLEQAEMQRAIEQAEQELWLLTAADEPDVKDIEAKVRGVEKLKADQRLAFIRAVGGAAQILTDEQRKQLTGDSQPTAAMADD